MDVASHKFWYPGPERIYDPWLSLTTDAVALSECFYTAPSWGFTAVCLISAAALRANRTLTLRCVLPEHNPWPGFHSNKGDLEPVHCTMSPVSVQSVTTVTLLLVRVLLQKNVTCCICEATVEHHTTLWSEDREIRRHFVDWKGRNESSPFVMLAINGYEFVCLSFVIWVWLMAHECDTF